LIIKRGTGHGAVVISLDEFKAILENVHLLSSRPNANRLYESIQQMKTGAIIQTDLIENA